MVVEGNRYHDASGEERDVYFDITDTYSIEEKRIKEAYKKLVDQSIKNQSLTHLRAQASH